MEQRRTRFVGTYEHGLDDKGRMVLPARIRAQLGEVGVVSKLGPCLGLWTQEGFYEVADQLTRRVEDRQTSMNALRAFVGDAVEVVPDQQGRIVVPLRLRGLVGLEREAVTSGVITHAEIWAAQRWVAARDAGAEELDEHLAAHPLF